MDRHDGFRAWRDRIGDLRCVDIVSVRIDVDENRARAETSDRRAVAKNENGVVMTSSPRFDVERHQREQQSIGSGGTADRVFRLAIVGDRRFELAHFVAEHEALRIHHAFNCLVHLISIEAYCACRSSKGTFID